jgi:hypothetical protein
VSVQLLGNRDAQALVGDKGVFLRISNPNAQGVVFGFCEPGIGSNRRRRPIQLSGNPYEKLNHTNPLSPIAAVS